MDRRDLSKLLALPGCTRVSRVVRRNFLDYSLDPGSYPAVRLAAPLDARGPAAATPRELPS